MYICIEGVDGVGKTTVIKYLDKMLSVGGYSGIVTREPGSKHSTICSEIRKLILHYEHEHDITLAHLFAADAHQHLMNVVKPAIEEGKYVLSDRSIVSDYSYRPHVPNNIKQHNFELFSKLNPLVIILVTDKETCIKRMEEGGKLNQYERDHVMSRMADIINNYNDTVRIILEQYGIKPVYIPNNENTEIEDVINNIMYHISAKHYLEDLRDESKLNLLNI